jgi:tetratricopeptide (TPR) repeat protein
VPTLRRVKGRTLDAARLSQEGNAHLAAGRVPEALAAQQKAAALWPDSGAIQCNLGNALQAAGRMDEAAAALRRAVQLEPQIPEIHNNLGALLVQKGQPDEAVASLERALRLRPGYVDATYNLGNALAALERRDEAEAAFRRAAPQHPGARRNLAVAANQRGNRLVAANRVGEALAAYREALAADPADPDIRYNEALALLVSGDLAGGWTHYERRFECRGRKGPRAFAFPRWDGRAPLAGKAIFLFAEQGLGDTLQFARYLPLLAAQGAAVHLEAQPALHALLRTSFPELRMLTGKGDPVPAADYHLPLLSVPGALGTTLATIPAPPRYLRPPPERTRRWRGRLGAEARPRVGLVWSGAAGHQNDRNRSIAFGALARSLPTEGVRYYSLQKEIRAGDEEAVRAFAVDALGPELADFADTAAAADEMDLIVSVDTSVAHLAAGLGRPTWILLPYSPDWRWLLDREDSPWYPSARLLRQPEPNRWEPVLERVSRELRAFLGRWRERPGRA